VTAPTAGAPRSAHPRYDGALIFAFMPNSANQEAELRTALRPWLDRAADLVIRRIENAHQHAWFGSLPTAEKRLAELASSLKRHVSDARSNFYHQSFLQHARSALDPDIYQVGLGPEPACEQAARVARVLGQDYSADITDLVKDAKAGL
jgi:hypothetical protein